MSDDSLEELKRSLVHLQEQVQDLSKVALNARESLALSYSSLDKAVSKLENCKKSYKEAKKEMVALKKSNLDISTLEKLDQEIQPEISDLSQRLTPATGSMFVRLLLGKVNVKLYRDGERVRLKSEYEKFRGRTNPLIIVAGIVQYLFPRFYMAQVFFQIWLLYYYVTLALREQILRVNGSNINWWWIKHHYLSIVTSAIVLTWNWESRSYAFFYSQLMVYCICQGVVQVLMNQYQIGRLYNLVARGEASRMDVTAETVDPRFIPSMTTLMPFLLFTQLFQLYNSYVLLSYYAQDPYSGWQALAVGILFLVLSIGNLTTTLGIYIGKRLKSAVKKVNSNPLK